MWASLGIVLKKGRNPGHYVLDQNCPKQIQHILDGFKNQKSSTRNNLQLNIIHYLNITITPKNRQHSYPRILCKDQ
jgi:hypothetical protein